MQAIIDYVERFVPLTEDDKALLADSFTRVEIQKRQYIAQPDFTTKYRSYVLKGAFRSYVVCHKGQEHTIALAIDDWWISDYNSYIYQQPATLFVVAIEKSTVLRIDYETEKRLKASNHRLETFFRIIAEQELAYYQRRMIANLTLSAEDSYRRFMRKYPDIAARVPQYALASFLGMTTEYLSRLRNRRASGK
jgi:CRP-like cAMP-binding protein